MKNLANFVLSAIGGTDENITFLTDKDIQIIKGNFCTPSLFADSPTEAFKGMDFKYSSEKHLNIRKMIRKSANPNEGYYNETSKKFDYPAVVKNFEQIGKLAVMDSKGNATGLFLLTLKLESRKYIHFYFDFGKVKLELNKTAGNPIKSN